MISGLPGIPFAGRVIYWNYLNLAPPESLTIANAFARVSDTLFRMSLRGCLCRIQGLVYTGVQKTGFTIEVDWGKILFPYPNLILFIMIMKKFCFLHL